MSTYTTDTCLFCHKPFTFAEATVPKFPYADREWPICKSCVDRNNRMRTDVGQELIFYAPDTYPGEESV